MSRLYNIFYENISLLMRLILEAPDGTIDYYGMFDGPKTVKLFIGVVSTVLFLVLLLTVGVSVWNQGLSTMFPNVISHFGPVKPMPLQNSAAQFIMTLFAMYMFF